MPDRCHTILKSVFGYDEFRSPQEQVIRNILGKRDTLVIMPTGGGKSLCYQIPSLIFEGLTIVVSPLISLMKDQVEHMTETGVPAVFLNSSLPPDHYRHNLSLVMEKKVRLLYVAPESLLKENLLGHLSKLRVDCITIDEAHCISEWGHDFRPEYRQLASLRSIFSVAVFVALTATATKQVADDIRRTLALSREGVFVASFNRENLFLEVKAKTDPASQAIDFIRQQGNQSGIVYCATRKQVDDLAGLLAAEGFSVKPYHAGLTDVQRALHQEMFIKDDVSIIVATVAFGMGIDKPNVRFVLHYDLPKNIESYYQEIGRAGRDGLRSTCRLLFGYGDIQKIKYFMREKTEPEKKVAGFHLSALLRLVESEACRRIQLLGYFGEKWEGGCGMCDNCTEKKSDKSDLTVPAQKFLSCVKRTGERFGANYIIDVLRGSESKKVIQFGHQHLSTYGIGMEYAKRQWLQLSRQLLHQGLMVQDMDYGGLQLTSAAWKVFRGEVPVMGRIEAETAETFKKGQNLTAAGKTAVEQSCAGYDRDLFHLLKVKRKEMADEKGVPPYVIFSDKTLVEMAFYFPGSSESLLDLHGIGQMKLSKFGPTFLEIIAGYCNEHNIAEKRKCTGKKRNKIVGKSGK